MSENAEIPTLSDIKRAHQRIEKYILRTEILTSSAIDELCSASLYFKCENFQKTGSFKVRGACNAVFSMRPEDRQNGFATHSSGNHAQAVAYAAKLAGTQAFIVMPKNATEVKQKAVEGYGGKVTLCEPFEKDRISTCEKLIRKEGATFIPPFEHVDIIAGQATAAKELIVENGELDYILTPVGGGGLAAGTALSIQYLSPGTKFVIGEPEQAGDTARSFRKGSIEPIQDPDTIADGLKVTVGQLNFDIIKSMAEDVITVTEQQIVEAMRIIWERMKIIIEPSSAVPFAVVLNNKSKFEGKHVGIILTGGNVDLTRLPF